MQKPLSVLLAVLAVIVLLPVVVLLALSHAVVMSVPQVPQTVGLATPVTVHLESPHGLRRVEAFLEQNGQRWPVYSMTQPATRLTFFSKHEPPRDVVVLAGKNKAPQVKDGKARLILEAQANDFRGNTATQAFDVDVNTQPPFVSADGYQHYINQGGSELVVFNVSGYCTESGVRVGQYTFRSFPMPGQPDGAGVKAQRFSIFAYPFDVAEGTEPIVYARNPAGTEARAHFWHRIFPKKYRTRDLNIDDKFLQRVVDQIEPNGPGDLLARFLHINGELRRENNKTLSDLRQQTESRFLWHGPFLQLGNSQVEAQYADLRTYIYNGKKVDTQWHLGFDLSKTAHVPIEASNDGKVLHAAPLGIYGNCIVVDHGYGLQSIYGHLSEIDVKVGDMVKKGQSMGRSGATGLAGGDHLHFSMQVDGVQVNPVEWWDAHWLKDRILSKVPAS